MKHIPLFLSIDVSGKTDGDIIKFFWEKFNLLIDGFRKNPFALELLHIELTFFNRDLIRVIPLTPICDLSPNNLKDYFKGVKSTPRLLGKATLELAEIIGKYEQDCITKNLWQRPIVIFFTAGMPNDTLDFYNSIIRLREKAEIFVFCLNETVRQLFSSRYHEVHSRRWGELGNGKDNANGAFEIYDLSTASESLLIYPLQIRYFS